MKDQITHYENKLSYEIDSWDLYERLSKDENIVVIDTRSKEAYNKSHIPSSINIPHRTITDRTTSDLKGSFLLVAYCDGIGCNASTKGALALAKLGFNVKELIGGLDWWLRDGYATNGANSSKGREIKCGC